MPLFFGDNENDSVGIDIGTSAIKIIHLKINNDGKAVFRNFAIARLRQGTIQSASHIFISQQISQILKLALDKSKIKCRSASFSIPSFSSFISFISIPKVYEDDLDNKLQIEARKYIPIPLSKVSLGWEIINEQEASKSMGVEAQEEKIKVLLMAVSNDTIQKYESIAQNSGLNLKSIEVESFSLVRCLTKNEKETVLILDIGSRVCNILIVSQGFLRGSRNIDLGGGDISEAISRSLNVDYSRSELLKRNLGNDDPQLSKVINPIISRITSESKRIIDAFNSKNPNRKVKKVILSGGTAKLKGFPQTLNSELNLPVIEGDPWQNIKISDKHRPILDKFKYELAVATGIAMNNKN
ncbi:MAG: type IV pilus assembly protein PilM [Patescibacteria group bacterium]|nr:type IV pilus assembly protein PilM [Patescibacteria group bacterium]